MNLLINANAKRIPIADNSVNCVVTSPPYYGLRDYGTAEWVGGDPECDHVMKNARNDAESRALLDGSVREGASTIQYRDSCPKCGAIRVDKQIGLEQSPDDYVEAMCQVFDEIWRVLRDDGTCWLNLGDSYNGSGGAGGDYNDGGLKEGQPRYPGRSVSNLKPKDLIGIPWRVAFALQARGWYLRQDIIWHKPNPMPESVKDRCTKAHEYIFLLTKSARYWYDNEAVKEPSSDPDDNRGERGNRKRFPTEMIAGIRGPGVYPMTNKRSVWTVTTKPYPGSHYAVFPPDLIEPCILAGCPETVCAECGAPYERVVERGEPLEEWKRKCGADSNGEYNGKAQKDYESAKAQDASATKARILAGMVSRKTVGFQPTCDCNAGTKAGVVLDPFAGSGTTPMVARKHRRNAIGLDLNFEYLTTNARERLQYGSFVPVADGISQMTINSIL